MLRSRIGRASLPALAAVAALAMVSAAADARFTVAVLRRDGVMIPFASFNGRAWNTPWPGAAPNVVLPISLDDVPKEWWGSAGPAAPWTAWLADGSSRPLKLNRPVHVQVFCGAHLGIGTDYRAQAPVERGPTVAKDGVAIAGDARLEPVPQISVLAADAARMVAAITAKFNEEEAQAAESFTRWRHPFGAAARAAAPIVLEAFYRSIETTPHGELRTSYIEAIRKFPALPRDEGCGLITFVHGWVTEVPGKKPVIDIRARVTYCDREDVPFIQPFGRFVARDAGGRVQDVFWVYQLSSWRNEFYSVARVTKDGVRPVVGVSGGGCPKEPAP